MEENGKVWISVDGGGTKTQFCACNIEGQKLYDRSFALSNYKSSNLKQVSENLQEAFKNLMIGEKVLHGLGISILEHQVENHFEENYELEEEDQLVCYGIIFDLGKSHKICELI